MVLHALSDRPCLVVRCPTFMINMNELWLPSQLVQLLYKHTSPPDNKTSSIHLGPVLALTLLSLAQSAECRKPQAFWDTACPKLPPRRAGVLFRQVTTSDDEMATQATPQ